MNPLITIIIPCYNHGKYIDDALNSIQVEKYKDLFEIIVVNDGSNDPFTISKVRELSEKGINVIHQENKGLAAARNKGIENSKGKYILPLDSDNKIIPEVFIEAASIMENNAEIDVVYTDAEYFGNQTGDWIVGEFEGNRFLLGNYIDACALIRRKTLLEFGGYDGNMPAMGHEDWELWVNFFLNGREMSYLPKTGFYYRVTNNSMSVTTTRPNFERNKIYIFKKYSELISRKIELISSDFRTMKLRIESSNRCIKNNKFKTILKILAGREII